MHQFDVSVVLPAKNEAKNLSALLREIAEVVPNTTTEIIVVSLTPFCKINGTIKHSQSTA